MVEVKRKKPPTRKELIADCHGKFIPIDEDEKKPLAVASHFKDESNLQHDVNV